MNNQSHTIPSDYTPNDQVYSACEANGIPESLIKSELQTFILYFQEKKKKRMGWHRSYVNWLKNAVSYKKKADIKNKGTNPSANMENDTYKDLNKNKSKSRPNGMTLQEMVTQKGNE